MKKTVRINISGLVFTIDEDAFEKLQQYLNSITKKFIKTDEGNEIISDVEARIAELFQERIGDRKEVVNISDVEHVIEIMGMPEDFEEDDDESTSETSEPYNSKKTNRRIFRDREKGIISGLAAGIAQYFGIDPIIVRVIFVLMALFYGTSILIYILLWIIVPEAKTRSQKLQMLGKDINLSNIETSIKNELSNVKSNFDKWQKSGSYNKIKTNFFDILKSGANVFVIIAKVILIIIGVFIFISGIGILGTLTGVYFFNDSVLSPLGWSDISFSLYEFTSLFTDNFNAKVAIITSFLVIVIPVLAIIYLGLKFIFRFKTRKRFVGVFSGALWLVSLIVLIGSAAKIGFGMRAEEEVHQSYKLREATTDTLYLNIFKQDANNWNNKERFGNVYIDFDDKNLKLNGRPWLNIRRNDKSVVEISITKNANGINEEEALQLAKNIDYSWQQDDSVLFFSRYFNITGDKKVRDQRLDIELKIPVGKIIHIGEDINNIAWHIDNIQGFGSHEMSGKYWIMTDNGLSLLEEYYVDKKEDELIEEANNNSDSIETTEFKEEEDKFREEIEAMKSELDNM